MSTADKPPLSRQAELGGGSIAVGMAGGFALSYGLCNFVFGLPSGGTSLLWCTIVAGGAGGAGGGWLGAKGGKSLGNVIYEKTWTYD